MTKEEEDKVRLHPNDKENFMEGMRQKWCAIFAAVGMLIMLATSYGWLKDPAPFLTFFTGIGVTFILGASASSVMASYKVNSLSSVEIANIKEEKFEEKIESIHTVNENYNIDIEEKILKLDYIDPKYIPLNEEEV